MKLSLREASFATKQSHLFGNIQHRLVGLLTAFNRETASQNALAVTVYLTMLLADAIIFVMDHLPGFPKSALIIGDKAPEFTLLGDDDQEYTLSKSAINKSLVVVFYRGDW